MLDGRAYGFQATSTKCDVSSTLNGYGAQAGGSSGRPRVVRAERHAEHAVQPPDAGPRPLRTCWYRQAILVAHLNVLDRIPTEIGGVTVAAEPGVVGQCLELPSDAHEVGAAPERRRRDLTEADQGAATSLDLSLDAADGPAGSGGRAGGGQRSA